MTNDELIAEARKDKQVWWPSLADKSLDASHLRDMLDRHVGLADALEAEIARRKSAEDALTKIQTWDRGYQRSWEIAEAHFARYPEGRS